MSGLKNPFTPGEIAMQAPSGTPIAAPNPSPTKQVKTVVPRLAKISCSSQKPKERGADSERRWQKFWVDQMRGRYALPERNEQNERHGARRCRNAMTVRVRRHDVASEACVTCRRTETHTALWIAVYASDSTTSSRAPLRSRSMTNSSTIRPGRCDITQTRFDR